MRRLLERLEQEFADQGAPIVDVLRPGLSDGEIDELTRPLGISVPEELRAWWRWHDGAAARHVRETIGGDYEFSSLSDCVAQTRFQRDLGQDWAGDDGDANEWFPAWALAVVQNNGVVLACDCSGARDDPVPTRNRPRDEPYTRSVQGPSFATVVSWWVDALATRAWVWDRDRDRWSDGPGVIPAERRATGLV